MKINVKSLDDAALTSLAHSIEQELEARKEDCEECGAWVLPSELKVCGDVEICVDCADNTDCGECGDLGQCTTCIEQGA